MTPKLVWSRSNQWEREARCGVPTTHGFYVIKLTSSGNYWVVTICDEGGIIVADDNGGFPYIELAKARAVELLDVLLKASEGQGV